MRLRHIGVILFNRLYAVFHFEIRHKHHIIWVVSPWVLFFVVLYIFNCLKWTITHDF